MAFWDFVTKPVRGIGRLLRGKFNEGLADIGSGAKTLAPIALGATGFGLPAAIAAGAAGGALERAGESNWHGKSILGGAAEGGLRGAVGHGAGSLGRAGVGRLLAGQTAGTAAASAAPASVPSTLSVRPSAGSGLVSSVTPAPAAIPSSVAPLARSATPPAGAVGRFLSGAGKVGGEAATWLGKNIGDVSQGVGAVTSLYGASQEADERDWMRRMVEEDRANEMARAESMSPIYAELLKELLPDSTYARA